MATTQEKIISCLIPVYNVASYIERCLFSLFSNTIASKVEFIIVNDFSTDNSMEIVYRLLSEFPDIYAKIINHEKNRGLAAVRNTGIDNATGKYVCFVDSDDWVESNYFETLLTLMESDKDNDVAFASYDSSKPETIYCDFSVLEYPLVDDIVNDRLKSYLWHKIYKTSIIKENQLKWIEGIDYLEDLVFSTQYFSYVKKFSLSQQIIYHYMIRDDSIVCSASIKNFRDECLARKFCLDYLEKKNLLTTQTQQSVWYRINMLKKMYMIKGSFSNQKYFSSFMPASKIIASDLQYGFFAMKALKTDCSKRCRLRLYLFLHSMILIAKGKLKIGEYFK